MATADLAEAPARRVRPAGRIASRKVIKWTVASLLGLAAVLFAIYYWWSHRLYVSTDDAYVNANITEIAAQVSGPVIALHVRDQQKVQAGQPLFDIARAVPARGRQSALGARGGAAELRRACRGGDSRPRRS